MVHVSNEEISGGVPLLCLVPSSTLTLGGQQDISYLSPTTTAVRRSTSTTTTLSLDLTTKYNQGQPPQEGTESDNLTLAPMIKTYNPQLG